MKIELSKTRYTHIELDEKDIIQFVNTYHKTKMIPDNAVIRFYTKQGHYYDISDEYPIIIFFEEKTEEKDG